MPLNKPVEAGSLAESISTVSSGAPAPRSRLPGLLFLLTTSVGWGLNWPVTKRLLDELPPLSLRGGTGVIGAFLIAGIAVAFKQKLKVPPGQWPRLIMLSVLNVTSWMALMGLALVWLPASEAAVLAYTMPVWASVLAWPILGERISLVRVIALLMALAGLVALMGGSGIAASMEKLPGIVLALVGAFAFALGTVIAKRAPLSLPPLAAAAWQVGIGCLPVAIAGLIFESPHISALTPLGWWLFAYSVLMQFCVAYVCWFAALERLPASVAAIGTTLVPVIGVVASAITLGEPLGPGQIAALVFIIAGVMLATRS
ncbi:DMT family transporter [Afipia sp. Root123D2]|uniref:DMT family transporter n=1 Tax=Afipia sp. Root123D2 TaxID=1736436 RepID=UPI0009E6DB8F|nr:DMT family transporter [Afipia sp. Root123D2]